jgi:hypothetical protein
MRRFLASLFCLAAAFAGCGKASDSSSSSGGSTGGSTTETAGPQEPPIDPATVGSISGVVKLEGWLKPDGDPAVRQVPYCASCHPNGAKADTLILGDGQTMANVLVYVKSGLGKRKFDLPKSTEVLDQVGCLYTPHVVAIRANQTLVVRNSDNTMHNINGSPKLNTPFNYGQSGAGVENAVKFTVPENFVPIQCNVHPWMKAYVHVLPHPFFQLTGKDGAYSITGLPPGEYEVHALHEKFIGAPLVTVVKVEAKGKVTQNFEFKGGEKPAGSK